MFNWLQTIYVLILSLSSFFSFVSPRHDFPLLRHGSLNRSRWGTASDVGNNYWRSLLSPSHKQLFYCIGQTFQSPHLESKMYWGLSYVSLKGQGQRCGCMLLVQDLGNTLVCNVGYQILDITIYCSSWNSGVGTAEW